MLSGDVPVLDIGGDVDYSSGQNLDGSFPFFLIPAPACDAVKHLAAPFRDMVDMPVVAAARLEGDIRAGNLLGCHRSEVAVAIRAAVNLFISGIYWLPTQKYVKSAFRK